MSINKDIDEQKGDYQVHQLDELESCLERSFDENFRFYVLYFTNEKCATSK